MKNDGRKGFAIKPAHRWTGYQGLVLAGDSWGDPGTPLVVLLHGAGQTRHAWKATGTVLGHAGLYAIAFDARGHGDSDWSGNGLYGPNANVADLLAILAQLDESKPILVGASMGGNTSLIATGEAHIETSALVLVDTAPHIESDGVARIRRFMAQNPNGFDTLEDVARAIATYQPHRTRSKSLEGLAKNVRVGTDGRYYWHWDPRTRETPVDLPEREKRLRECARRLAVPTLLVRGGLSDVLSQEGADDFLALCPHSEYVNVAGGAHMVAGDRNDLFARSVVDFLTRAIVTNHHFK